MRHTSIICDACLNSTEEATQHPLGLMAVYCTIFGWFDICKKCEEAVKRKEIAISISAKILPLETPKEKDKK